MDNKRLFDGERIYARGDYLKCARMAAVKQEEVDTTNDTSGGQITHASSIQKFKGKKIHLKPGKFILRGEPCKHYLDEFSRHVVWGNTVRLYNHNVHALQKIIRSTTTPNNYYVCHMTETFATQGKRMYFNVHFSTGSLFPHMDADHDELTITTGDGTTTVTARFIKGVDKRATITKGWSDFFRWTHMNEGKAYAFGFKCTSKGLHLIVYSI
ncbi:hypothetical protein VPH35_030937 [Triticum aestivum]